MTRTEELLALAEAATPGPWIEAGDGGDNLSADGKPIKYDSVFYDRPDDPDDYDAVCRDTTHEDSKFIAACNPAEVKRMVEVMLQMREALIQHSTHYECEDTFYSCPAHETAWEERKGECCCGADKVIEAITAFDAWQGGE